MLNIAIFFAWVVNFFIYHVQFVHIVCTSVSDSENGVNIYCCYLFNKFYVIFKFFSSTIFPTQRIRINEGLLISPKAVVAFAQTAPLSSNKYTEYYRYLPQRKKRKTQKYR